MALSKKIRLAGSWVVAGHLSSQLIRLSCNLIMTRLLVPDMFGIMAVVTICLIGVTMLSDIGISQYLIQRKQTINQTIINTAWTLQVVRGVILALLVVMLAACIAKGQQYGLFNSYSVYADEQLPLVLAVMALSSFLAGLTSLNLVLMQRDLQQKQTIMIEVISQLVGTVVMIIMAYYLSNIWSIVVGSLLTVLIKTLLSHHKRIGERCHFAWDSETVRAILQFGRWVFIASLLTFIAAQGDRLILASWLSAAELGVYTIAFFIATAGKELVKKVMGSVLYPALSQVVRENPHQLKTIYYQLRLPLDSVIMVLAGLMASGGEWIISLLYDERYIDAGWMLQLLSLSIVLLGTSMAGVLIMALGNSLWPMWMTLVSAVTLVFGLPLVFSWWGLPAAITLIALHTVVEFPVIMWCMKRYQLWSWWGECRLWPVFFISYALGKSLIELT